MKKHNVPQLCASELVPESLRGLLLGPARTPGIFF
jgi:hypothetical protein